MSTKKRTGDEIRNQQMKQQMKRRLSVLETTIRLIETRREEKRWKPKSS